MCRVSLVLLLGALALAEVTSWTIDVPEARRFLFEKNDRLEEKTRETETDIENKVLLSNRYDSNSKHHEKTHRDDDDDDDHYAKDYGYQSYVEKTVRDIVSDGSEYVEGLRRSVARFERQLDNCTALYNQTNVKYFFNETAFNATAFNMTSYNATFPPAPGPLPWQPASERALNATGANSTDAEERCRRARRAAEHVRRLAQLAIKTTKELQDIAYSRKYMKEDPHELLKEENELILKLAWFLDRLAHYTDYRPQTRPPPPDDYPVSKTSTAPPAAAGTGLLNATAATTRLMMECLKQQSPVPATVRCAYPQEIPSVVQFLINNTNPAPGGVPSPSDRNERVLDPRQHGQHAATSEQELLIATDDRLPYLPYHHLTAVTHVHKRSTRQLTREKRETENPAITFMKYFVKHKIWEHDNPIKPHDIGRSFETFEVNNHIPHRVHKRETNGKKLEIPEDPFQDLSKYIKSKKGVSYVKDEEQAQRIRDFIQKIRHTKPTTAKEHSRHIAKLFRTIRSDKESENAFRSKRSYTYESEIVKPRAPDDLFQDISYYVKNKPGTSYNRDLVQAGQVRAGLLQIFSNPNIETVRRYGANYNPLVPDPLTFGALRSAADN